MIIVAHPRSGSTWLRTMIANIISPVANSNPVIFNKMISGVSIRNALAVNRLSSPRILTSHISYLPGLPKVIYVVRDGRDAIVSYYHYDVHRKTFFIDRYYQGAYRHIWHQHVESLLT